MNDAQVFISPEYGVQSDSGWLVVDETVRLRWVHYSASEGDANTVVVILQGRSECIERYEEVISECMSRGLDVVTFDWRGQGASSRALPDSNKGHIEDFQLYQRDLIRVMAQVVRPLGHRRRLLLAHSMGGHLALHHAKLFPTDFERIALSAPMVDIALGGLSPALRTMVRTLNRVGAATQYVAGTGPWRGGPEFEGNDLTSDRARFMARISLWNAYPHLAIGGPTYGWVAAALRSIRRLGRRGYLNDLRVPVLMLLGEDDSVVHNGAARRLLSSIERGRVQTLSGARHEVMQERDSIRQEFWRTLDAFFSL